MKSINETIRDKQLTVNSYKRNKPTVNDYSISSIIGKTLKDANLTNETIAKELATQLEDPHSLRYYQLLANENRPEKLLEALSYVKYASSQGNIRTKKATYFMGILKKWGIQTKFAQT